SYARRACFLYEWLFDDTLDAPNLTRGNYIDALDSELYLVGKPINCPRWRVRDNLPGNRDYCPIVRRTAAIQATETYNLSAK
ncbi:cell filamentation protein Fic, partial [Acinetobacter baumannii]